VITSTPCAQVWKGEVIFVTDNGGIKVRVIDARPWFGAEQYKRRFGNEVRWVPYHIR